jgi:hypothetical protein
MPGARPARGFPQSPARRLADRVEESGLEPLRFLRLLKKYLRGLLQEMRANQTIGGSQSARGESLLEKLFTRIETPSDADGVLRWFGRQEGQAKAAYRS